jgi:DNA-binding beta-propeller fold protein YncE
MRWLHRALTLTSVVSSLLLTGVASATAESSTAPNPSVQAPRPRGSTVALDRDSLVAYVADSDNKALHRVDLVTGTVVTTALGCVPADVLLLSADRVAVAMRGCNEVRIIDIDAAGEGTTSARMNVPVEPWGLALGAGNVLFVTSAYGRALTALDAESLAVRFSVPLAREPRGIAVTSDGRRAFVTHAVGDAISVVDIDGGSSGEAPRVRSVRTLGGKYRNRVDELVGAKTIHPTSSLAYAPVMNEAGTRLFVSHLVVQNGESTAQFIASGYGGVSIESDTSAPSVAVIDVARERPLGAIEGPVPHDFINISSQAFVGSAVAPTGSSARQARAAATLGDTLLVASQGSGELVELDAQSLDPAMAPRRTFRVGEGPTGIDVDPRTNIAVVWNQNSHDLAVVSLGSGAVDTLPVAEDPLRADIARGRALFHAEEDRRISRDGRACASCHPEGRDDGIVWRLGDGPRQTLTLAGHVESGPYGWHGAHKTLEANIGETIVRLGGSGLTEQDLAALANYLREGLFVPQRSAPPASAEALVAHGRDLYMSDKLGCNGCHDLGHGTSDREVHDVGSKAKGESRTAFRTPPLGMLEGTAPYFHDGRYATLEALLDDNLDRMGQTSQLAADDRAALLAFLRTL